MEYNSIEEVRKLLELYFEGGTDLRQEETLRTFFRDNEVPDDMLYAKAMFGGFRLGRQLQCSREVDIIKEAPAPVSRSPRSVKLRRLYTSMAAAAAILIVGGIATLYLKPEPPTVYCYVNGVPVTDIEMAAEHARLAGKFMESYEKASEESISAVQRFSKPIEEINRVLEMAGLAAGE